MIFFIYPASAEIDITTSSNYDFGNITDAFGEEIHGTVLIKPGNGDVNNLQIKFFEIDGFIDQDSFEKTISPADSQAIISVQDNVLKCDRLAVGEQLTISFNSYPKTIKQEMITPVLLDASYTQLGEPLDKKVNLQTDMKNSSWFKLQNTKSSTEIVTISIYLIILCFIIVIILILILKLRSSKISNESQKNLIRYSQFLNIIKTKISAITPKTTELIDLLEILDKELLRSESEKSLKQPIKKSGEKSVSTSKAPKEKQNEDDENENNHEDQF